MSDVNALVHVIARLNDEIGCSGVDHHVDSLIAGGWHVQQIAIPGERRRPYAVRVKNAAYKPNNVVSVYAAGATRREALIGACCRMHGIVE